MSKIWFFTKYFILILVLALLLRVLAPLAAVSASYQVLPVRHDFHNLVKVLALENCESRHRDIQIIDSNGKWSRGRLMYQDETWQRFEKESGYYGNPMNGRDARIQTDIAIDNGHIGEWSCAAKLGY